MDKRIKKSGRKIIKNISRVSKKASTSSKKHIKTHLFGRISNVKNVRLWILEWALLVLAITLFAVVQQLWSSNAYETKVFTNGGSYTEGTLGVVNSMNPLYASTSSEKTLARLLFSSLLSIDASGQLGNDLASSVKSDDTAKTWTVTLKDNLKWSDGTLISADDIIFTFELIKNPSSKTTFVGNFSKIEVERVSEQTLRFLVPDSYPAFKTLLTFPILPKHILGDTAPALVFEHAFSANPIGSGPFVLNAAQTTDYGRIIYLNRNNNYYRGKSMLDSFTLRTYDNSEQLVKALNRADLSASADLKNLVDPEVTSTAFYKKETRINSGVFAFLNTSSSGYLQDPKLRQAIQAGVDLASLRAGLVDEYPLDYPILKEQVELDFPALPAPDKHKFEELIKSANLTQKNLQILDEQGTQVTFILAAPGSGVFPELASRLKEQLENLGFAIELRSDVNVSSKEFFSAIVQPRTYDILLYEIDLGIDADPFAYYHSSQATNGGLNLSNYNNNRVDDLLLSARTTTSEKLRAAKYSSFLKYWVSDVPAIGIYQGYMKYYFNRNVRSFSENNTLVSPLDRFSDVLYWASEKDFRNRTP